VIKVAPQQTYATQIALAVHSTSVEVAAIEKRIGELQHRAHPILHDRPQAAFSPSR
jgi:hypothetical protein